MQHWEYPYAGIGTSLFSLENSLYEAGISWQSNDRRSR